MIDTIWIIDDDEIHQLITRRLLERFHEVGAIVALRRTKSALEHLERVEQGADALPDLVFAGLLPESRDEDRQFLKRYGKLVGHYPHVPLFFLVTASTQRPVRRQSGWEDYITGYLSKPFSPGRLSTVLLAAAQAEEDEGGHRTFPFLSRR
ncbi:hypothetical protein SAMN05421823_106122 [Catalinimonas alkaloidigena]|uniref:Response regulatory domain-containing protein n=1 Tax=Catalinimonas alkaloidigena TaxID=1075417 RepID=A0A1G9KCB5_9BACT|nr:hypothetical protein [Catalinimonas alkaloidigena]SDL47458.1 hypothetical protein SAMN05421823_106122 [Catalinimonas alkaloidigena]